MLEMLELMAQISEQGTNNAQWLGYVIGAAIAAMVGGGAGGAILSRRISRQERKEERERDVCPLHDVVMQNLDERKLRSDKDIADLKQSIGEVKDEMGKGFEIVYRKLDRMNNQGGV